MPKNTAEKVPRAAHYDRLSQTDNVGPGNVPRAPSVRHDLQLRNFIRIINIASRGFI